MPRESTDARKELRLRVERILSGASVAEDLRRLFSHFRFITAGQAPGVKDIADFEAHREGRNSGESWKRGRDFLAIASFQHYFGDGSIIVADIRTVRGALKAALRVIGSDVCRRGTGFSFKKSTALLDRACGKIRSLEGSVFDFTILPTREEMVVLSFVSTFWAFNFGFDKATLVDELTSLLLRDGLLTNKETAQFRSRENFIALYAVYVMHGHKLDFEGKEVNLSLTTMVGNVAIHALFVFNEKWVAAPIFSAGCDPVEWVHKSLLEKQMPADAVIELDPSGRLVPLGASNPS